MKKWNAGERLIGPRTNYFLIVVAQFDATTRSGGYLDNGWEGKKLWRSQEVSPSLLHSCECFGSLRDRRTERCDMSASYPWRWCSGGRWSSSASWGTCWACPASSSSRRSTTAEEDRGFRRISCDWLFKHPHYFLNNTPCFIAGARTFYIQGWRLA